MDARDYSDREKIDHDEISLALCRRMGALLDLDPGSFSERDEWPIAWSSLLFPAVAPQGEIGEDGHPRRGEFLPDIKLPRRRFAGRQVELLHPLRIGDRLTRRSTIADVTEKEGRSGPMVFVAVLHEISAGDRLVYTERQNVVYLGAPVPGVADHANAPRPLPPADWSQSVQFDPVMLFRYSALTYNGHRIHYDKTYATSVEGYAGLVVNGGLTTLFLLELARRRLSRPITGYTVRALNVLFADDAVELCGAETEQGASLWAVDTNGRVAMRIEVVAG